MLFKIYHPHQLKQKYEYMRLYFVHRYIGIMFKTNIQLASVQEHSHK